MEHKGMLPGLGGQSWKDVEQGGGSGEEAPNVSPEEQAQYDQFVGNALKLIYEEPVLRGIVTALSNAENKKAALANATASIVIRLQETAREQNRPVSDDVAFHGGVAILEDIANLAKEAGIHEFTVDEIEDAGYAAIDLYGSLGMKTGFIDKDSYGRAVQDLDQAAQGDRLEELLPGITEAEQHMKKRGRLPERNKGKGEGAEHV